MPALPVTATTTPTVRNIFAALESKRRTFRSRRLSASQIAGPCDRQLWDGFRWLFATEKIDGQKASIFETGNLWEERLLQRLRDAGMTITDVDPVTGRQIVVRFAGGHGNGKLDALALNVPEAPKTEHVVEIKSHKDDSFKKLLKQGVRDSKPEHFGQTQIYMHERGVSRGLYLAVNKNDDALYAERLEYDAPYCLQLVARAERIVTSDHRPACSCPPHFLKAGYGCAVNEGVMPVRSCRSCIHATARLDGDGLWSCARHGHDLATWEEQEAGCANHLFNPTTIPGEQVDFDEARERVTYRLGGGEVWVDGARVS